MKYIAIIVIIWFLYRRNKKGKKPVTLSSNRLFICLLILPIIQLLCSFVPLLLSFVSIDLLSSKSQILGPIIKENLGVFNTIANDLFEEYRSDALSPYISDANKYHGWSIYLVYAAIVMVVIHIFVLIKRVVSKEILLGLSFFFSIAILVVSYYVYYNYSMGFNKMMSAETLGLLSSSSDDIFNGTIDFCSFFALVLFFCHYYHSIWLRQYYDEVDKTDITSTESLIETDSSDEQSDDNKYQNLKDLKALLDAGILTQEEFDAQKKEILNS